MRNLNKIYHLAIEASIEASSAIKKVYYSEINVTIKTDGSPVTQADMMSSKIIANFLSPTEIPIMGEERKRVDYHERVKWHSHWCVDPLDGTKMFILKNDEFAVNIAHVKNGEAIFGLIADPIKQRIIIGLKDKGVFTFSFDDANQPEKWQKINAKKNRNQPVIIACSRGFGSKSNEQKVFGYDKILIKEYGEFDYLKMGSALKFFELAEGRADIYVRLGPTMEWDIAAGQVIIEELGGSIESIETGERLTYNKKSLFNPPFIVKTKAVLEE